MKNLLSREEFLNQLDEGFIRDTFRKGVNAIKKVLSIGMKKIKNFIASFDTNGNVLPVVSLQATIDHFSGNKNVQVFAPKEISDSVVEYKFTPPTDDYTITKDDKGIYHVEGPAIKKLFDRTDFNNETNVRIFAQKLRKMGVDEKLRKLGVQHGDTVLILGYEFEMFE